MNTEMKILIIIAFTLSKIVFNGFKSTTFNILVTELCTDGTLMVFFAKSFHFRYYQCYG